jgi:GTPase SAR1 family protein
MRKKGHASKDKRTERFGHLDKKQRIALTEKVFIRYPRLRELYVKIDNCRTHSRHAAEPECMLVTGLQGAGKTTLIGWYTTDSPIQETPEKRIVPVLAVTVPSPATIKGLATEMLNAVGDPAADKGTVSSITLRLRKYLQGCDIELIILDEFQHFDERQSKNVLKTISDWLKNLINQTQIPIVLVGMPGCESVLEAKGNEQLKRRFSSREQMAPFHWDNPKQIEEFRQLLKRIDDDLPLLRDSHLAESTTAFLIYSATDGVINYVMKLLRRAAALAIEWDTEQIDLPGLAQAYEERLAQDFKTRTNPFGQAHRPRHVPKSANRAVTPGAMSRRVKGQKRKPLMSDVLRHR